MRDRWASRQMGLKASLRTSPRIYELILSSYKTVTCSCTSSCSELSNLIKIGTAPVSITTLVCRKVPEAMFVKAQAASNCLVQRRPC